MAKWSDYDHKLLLLTPREFEALPDGTVVTSIAGEKLTKGVGHFDDDIRFGHLAYGVTKEHLLHVAARARR